MLALTWWGGASTFGIEGYGVGVLRPLGVEGDVPGHGAVVEVPLAGWCQLFIGIPALQGVPILGNACGSIHLIAADLALWRDCRSALGVEGHGDGLGNPDGEELHVLRHGFAIQYPLVAVARVPVRKVAAVLGEVLWPLGGFAMLHGLYEVGLPVIEVEGYGVGYGIPLGVEVYVGSYGAGG